MMRGYQTRKMPQLYSKALEALEHQGWTLVFEENSGQTDEGLTMSVEILQDGERKTRMTLTRTGNDPRETQLHRLERRAIAWIDEYRARPHSGDTSFGELG